jgi:hypothetical protein
MEKRLWRGVRPNGEMRGKWGKCDLKAGHGRLSSSAFDRTVLAVDRTRAWRRWCTAFAFELTG